MQAISREAFTPASNPERGNNIGAMKWAFIYVKRAKAKNSVISQGSKLGGKARSQLAPRYFFLGANSYN